MPGESDKMKVFYAVLEFLGFIALLLFLYFAVCNPMNARADSKSSGEWVCWARSVEKHCAAGYIDKYMKWALTKAVGRCEVFCESKCKLDYCTRTR